MTLTDFLLARIAEDEAGDAGGHDYWCSWSQASEACDCPRKRIMAECEAKRRIVAEHEGRWITPENWWACDRCGTPGEYDVMWPCPTLRLLATVYADHPDYDEAWRP